ncbi:Cobalamin biosynthesis protein CobD/CbiB [Pseudobutyrivibrio sp. UC1225]|uniref:cobalamin biosynthesis protein n=1 Tax=Pseudobutyrivibrio sp. UC1225 TaxID=1798185 RepID=UPI0008F23384|nr:cobalamin biosynthesis protein [Pseudobutyrivibrio sp. UC1225]SFN50117.1 Cobalamin biosynthesis protein CobD/CbiB [Pseudobutyrivibrio sp. UC1225]
MFKLHILALLLGTILEFVFGRIYSLWNPMDTIKRLVEFLDRALLGDEIILLEPSKQRSFGRWLIVIVVAPVFLIILFFNILCYEIAPSFGVLFEAVATYFCLDYHRLYYGGLGVTDDFYGDGIDAMKHSAGILMNQEENADTEPNVTKNVITYIAKETDRSVLSSLLVMFLFGPVGGFLYRSLMLIQDRIGNSVAQNRRYEFFGQPIVSVNKVVDWLPSRVSSAIVVFAARHTFGGFNGKNARYIHLRDGQGSVSAFAGALDIALENGLIGDDDKVADAKDIRKAVGLLRNSYLLCQVILVILLLFF